MFITKQSLFFSFFSLCGFLVFGCEAVSKEEQGSTSTSSQDITVSGLAYYDITPVSDAQVLFVNADNTEVFATTMTDENGRFSLSLDQGGTYEIHIGRATEDGHFDKEYVLEIGSDATTYDIGEIEVEFYPMGSNDFEITQMYELEYNDDEFGEEFSTMEGALGYGNGCIAIGCSVVTMWCKEYLCCGWNLCKIGWEKCVPLSFKKKCTL